MKSENSDSRTFTNARQSGADIASKRAASAGEIPFSQVEKRIPNRSSALEGSNGTRSSPESFSAGRVTLHRHPRQISAYLGTCPPLSTVGLATMTSTTLRLTQQYLTTMTSSPSRVPRMNLRCHQVSNSPVCPRAREGAVGGRWLSHAMSRARSVSGQYPLRHGVPGQQVLDLLALEDDVFQRCLSAQPASHSAAEVQQGQLCSSPARPRRCCALLSQQLLHLTYRWWSESEGPDIEEGDVSSLAAAAYIRIKLHSARYPDPAPFQLPDPQQPARSLTDLLTTLAAILGRRQPHNVPLLHTALAVHEVTEEYRILESSW